MMALLTTTMKPTATPEEAPPATPSPRKRSDADAVAAAQNPTASPTALDSVLMMEPTTTVLDEAAAVGPAADIPTIDFGPFLALEGIVVGDSPTEGQIKVAQAIDDACRSHGFIHLVNFGLDPELREECFQASAELFALDATYKETHMCRISPDTNRGYSPFRSEQLNRLRSQLELKEAFNVRFPPKHQNDYSGCPSNFSVAAEKLQGVMKSAAHRYALACALALDLPATDSNLFVDTLKEFDSCTIRFLHGPPCPDEFDNDRRTANGGDLERPIRVGEHTDFGMVTFLLLGKHGAEGLQLKSVEGGDLQGSCSSSSNLEGWDDVVVPPTGAIINTGALMARWTNDEWKATAHRVIVANKVVASRDRYSIAFFVDPDKNSIVDVHDRFVVEGATKKYEPITSGDYLTMKLKEMMG
jgi:isopenicillin N synthase-like dioxygenase